MSDPLTHSRRAALRVLASLPALHVLPAVALPGSTLAALSNALEAAWDVERAALANGSDDEVERTMEATRTIVYRIIAEPARTLDDLRVKARAFLWCYAGDLDEAMELLTSSEEETADHKVLFSVMRDLLALADNVKMRGVANV
jgi:hypothetical protein